MEGRPTDQVYTNLVKMLAYRNVVQVGSALTMDDLAQRLNNLEYVTINGTRGADDVRGAATVIIVLIAPGSKYSAKSAEFKKIIKGLPKTKPGEQLEVIFVSSESLTSHIKRYIDKHRAANTSLRIEHYDYSFFLIEAPRHVSVPRHTVATREEVEAYCKYFYTTKERFPMIRESTDPQAVWLGLRPGMVVRIERPSDTAGFAVVYRRCVEG
jgi:DNA-directed RNA polymerase subunit H (RpoH/RPB5)